MAEGGGRGGGEGGGWLQGHGVVGMAAELGGLLRGGNICPREEASEQSAQQPTGTEVWKTQDH